MAWMCGLGWLCILLAICCGATVIASYSVALTYGHIYPFLPAISETGVLYPEKYVFRELTNLSAFLFISNAFVRFMQYKLVAEQCREGHAKLCRLNTVAFLVAILAGLGMTLVANFEIEKHWSIHDIGAMTAFFSGLTFCWLQCAMSYKLRDHGVINSSAVCHSRTMLALTITFCVLVFGVFQAKASVDWGRYRPRYHFLAKLKWSPKDPGYVYHVVSNTAEWCMCGGMVLFMLTFTYEFQQIVITSDISSTAYW
ncbi:DNA damage-regulated autophagy modulator protein 1-like [Acropora palmata]|uniref:DNA damage-regulated autophagy modulator protein 1-like n=1 Tax=Acropora palmata TaxID=6131 RepID=UPI003D9FC4D8